MNLAWCWACATKISFYALIPAYATGNHSMSLRLQKIMWERPIWSLPSSCLHVYISHARYPPPQSAVDVQRRHYQHQNDSKSTWFGLEKKHHGLALHSNQKWTVGYWVKDPCTTPPTCRIGTFQLLLLHHWQQHLNLMPSCSVSYCTKGDFWRQCLTQKSLTKWWYSMTSCCYATTKCRHRTNLNLWWSDSSFGQKLLVVNVQFSKSNLPPSWDEAKSQCGSSIQ